MKGRSGMLRVPKLWMIAFMIASGSVPRGKPTFTRPEPPLIR